MTEACCPDPKMAFIWRLGEDERDVILEVMNIQCTNCGMAWALDTHDDTRCALLAQSQNDRSFVLGIRKDAGPPS